MAARVPGAAAVRVAQSVSSVHHTSTLCTRSFASTSARPAPPKKAAAGSKGAMMARRKGIMTGDEDGAAGGQGIGNVLNEVTLPPPDLSGLRTLQPEDLKDNSVGEVRAFSPAALAAFKALTLPPTLEREFKYTSKPASVIRHSTIKAKKLLDSSKKASSASNRYVMTGQAGSGKSMLLLQTIAYAQATGWIVLYLPSATPLVNSSSPHTYSPQQALFDQPVLSQQLLSRFVNANKPALKALKTRKAWTFGERSIKEGTGLDGLASKNVDEKTATSVLEALFDELAAQNSTPVLLAIDDAQSLFATSAYVDPTYQPLESFSLTVPRLLLEFIAGTKSFTTGSILLAPSHLSPRQSPAMSRFLGASNGNVKLETTSPYVSVGSSFDIYSATLAGLSKFDLAPRLERKEAVGVVKMLQGYRGVREAMSDQHFLEKFVATDGSPRHFRRALEQSTAL